MSHAFKVLFSPISAHCGNCDRITTHTSHNRCLVCSKREIRERRLERLKE